ncbi:MAG: UTP--glucose-1-phosphate uridylyltransferase [Patescibacteria group bacterium]
MTKKVRKAVIPAAGFGTRFLPATKAMPKEMLPIVDKPIIQYVVEEAVASGIEDIIIVTGWHKRAVEDHFDYPFELEQRLREAGKEKELQEVRRIAEMANFIYIRQKGMYGNGTPVRLAREIIGDEPFVVLFGDDFIYADPPRTKQLIDVYNYYGGSALACIEAPRPEDKDHYGFIGGDTVAPGIIQIDQLVEKPGRDAAPSDIASVSGYLLTPSIFPILENLKPGKSGEIWLTDAINILMKQEAVYGCVIKNGKYYDTGNKLEYIKANIDFALQREDLREGLLEYLREIKF